MHAGEPIVGHALGGSITASQGAGGPRRAWPALVEKRINAMWPVKGDKMHSVNNHAIAGGRVGSAWTLRHSALQFSISMLLAGARSPVPGCRLPLRAPVFQLCARGVRPDARGPQHSGHVS